MRKTTLVLGIGNTLQKDDGIGCAVVQKMSTSSMQEFFQDVEFIDGGTYGFNLLPYLLDRKRVIIIDALKIVDTPGSIYHFPLNHIKSTGTDVFHSFNIPELIIQLRLMGSSPVVEIIGIVPENISETEIGLSNSLEESVPKVIDYISNLLHSGTIHLGGHAPNTM